MTHFRRLLVAVLGAVSLVGGASITAGAHEGGTLVEFDSMTPVTGSAVGAVNDRGIKGGGVPWSITSGKGEVSRNGKVEVKVTGLIVTAAGRNPASTFRATVSCLTPDGVVNVTTSAFPATTTGNAKIEERVALPRSCNSPILFVVNGTANATGFSWFAMSDAEEDDED